MVTIKEFTIGMIFMASVFLGMSIFAVDFFNHPRDSTLSAPSINNQNNFTSFDVLNSTISDLDSENNAISQAIINIPILAQIAAPVLQGLSVLKFVGSIPNVFLSIFTDLSKAFLLPWWASLAVQGLVLTIVVFVLISILTGKDEV